jgi:FlaA1/EpsC-like NDP-sugar epimerase
MTQPHNFRAWLAFVHDLCVSALAWAAMYWIRFGLDFHEPFLADMVRTLVWVLPLQAAIFVAFGLYRGLWRFASVLDLQRIVLAAGLGALLIPLVLVMLRLQAVVPRSVLIFYPIVLIFLMAGDRFAYRIWKEHRLYSPLAAPRRARAGHRRRRGRRAPDAGVHPQPQWRVVGLVDDDPTKRGRLLHGVSVLGPISSLPAWAKRYGVRQVIVALPSAAHGVRRRVAEICADVGIEVLTVPSYEDLISGRSALTTIRTIELDDLLGRDPVVLDNAGLGEWLGNRVVMVTGAGGSIGAELCRHIARYRPAKLVLFDLSEAAVYGIQTALADGFPAIAAGDHRR